MTDAPLVASVRRFIALHVPSMVHLEILLLLADDDERSWTADAVAQQLRSNLRSCARALEELASHRLLVATTQTTGANYRFAPHSHVSRRTVSRIAGMYWTRPVTLIRAIYSRSSAWGPVGDSTRRLEARD